MEHSEKYFTVKNWFSLGVWTDIRVRNAVNLGWITEAEYEEITGNAFE